MVDVGDDRQIAQRHKGNPVGPGRARATLQRNIGIGGAIATPKSANYPSVAKRAQGETGERVPIRSRLASTDCTPLGRRQWPSRG
jgi:hypothetical protein